MSEPRWKTELREQLDALSGSHPDLAPGAPLRAVIVSLVEVHRGEAHGFGVMAERSRAGYKTSRKKKENDPWPTAIAGAAGPTPASTTDDPGEP